MKKWTIAFVNYKTSVYLKWQIKGLFEFNNPEDFELIIIDNSKPTELKTLETLTKEYNDKYHNVKIIPFSPKDKSASGQHGEGMQHALEIAEGKYFLANDPDFFWVQKNWLNILASYLDDGKIAIGAPYPLYAGLGNKNFPCGFGCAHPTKAILPYGWIAETSEEKIIESKERFPDYDYSFDMGYKIREGLSTSDNSDNFISFKQKSLYKLADSIGIHSYEILTKQYSLNNKPIAFHLFRGSFTDKVNGKTDENKDLSDNLIDIRNKMAEYFYNYLKDGKDPLTPPFFNRLIGLFYRREAYNHLRQLIILFSFIKIKVKRKKSLF